MHCLIDADIVLHRCGFASENDDPFIALYRTDEMLDQILQDTKANSYTLYLSDTKENNFRYKIDSNYKANRTAPKPRHHEAIKEHMIVQWNAKIAHGMEADDALGINQMEDTIIVSIDKDLLQIPGRHYNFVKGLFTTVTPEQGFLSFYRSILTGDVADNIKGIYGIGPKKAEKILSEWESHDSAISKIAVAYWKWFTSEGKPVEQIIDTIRKNGQLLKIKQSEDEPNWDFPSSKQTEALMQLYTPQMQGEPNQSTEPTGQATMGMHGFPVAGQQKEDFSQTEKQLPLIF